MKILLAWKVMPLRLYCSGSVPPVATAVMVPSLRPQDAGDDVAVNVGPGRFSTVTGNVRVHKFASRTVRV